MRAYVDHELCIGCGLCTSIAPDVFAMNADGKAEGVRPPSTYCNMSRRKASKRTK